MAETKDPLIYFVSNRCSRTVGGVQTIIRLIEETCPEQTFIEIPLTFTKKELMLPELPNVQTYSLLVNKSSRLRQRLGIDYSRRTSREAAIIPGSKIIVFGVQKLALLSMEDLRNNEVIIFQSTRPDITFATLGSDRTSSRVSRTSRDNAPFANIPAVLEKRIPCIDKFLFYTEADRQEVMDLLERSQIPHRFRSYIVPNPSKTPRAKICSYTSSVMYMGRFDPLQKNIAEYIRLADRLDPSYTVNAYGDGVGRRALELSKVNVRGYIRDIREAARDNSILLLLSSSEGFGNVLVEAYSVGMPVIVYDSYPAARSVVKEGAGILVPFGDLDGVVAAIDEILASPETFQRYSEAAYAESANYIREDIIARYLSCIRD